MGYTLHFLETVFVEGASAFTCSDFLPNTLNDLEVWLITVDFFKSNISYFDLTWLFFFLLGSLHLIALMRNQIPRENISWHRYQFSQTGTQRCCWGWLSQWEGASKVRLFSKGWHWGLGYDTTVPFSLLLFLLCNLTLVQEEEILGLNWRQSA